MSFPLAARLRLAALGLALSLPLLASAQTVAPAPPTAPTPEAAAALQWYLLDPTTDRVMGVSVNRTYQELLAGRTPSPVVVAIIDAGIDTTHADLKRMLWRNAREVAGNGLDDDKNGYTDDVWGWNYLGGADGRNINLETLEETRLLAQLQPRFKGKTRVGVPAAQRADFDLYVKVKKSYDAKVKENTDRLKQFSQVYAENVTVSEKLKQALGVASLDTAVLRNPPTQVSQLRELSGQLHQLLVNTGFGSLDDILAEMKNGLKETQDQLDYGLNLNYNPRPIVGDDPFNVKQRLYGNADVAGPDPLHGTHVAGIIGADRVNNLGIMGIAPPVVRLMAVRAVPDGDERDKDVANAIRYAADHGASIINMSFGKYYSPQRAAVEEAIRYADSKGVLLVHSAGNENENLDQKLQFPTPVFLDGKRIPNMITVGASSRDNDAGLAADFSNFGKTQVDVFAPGNQIYSTLPGGRYGNLSGTSMAAPVVAGIAATLKSYFPELTAADLKRLILASAQPTHTQVRQPGSGKLVDFADLSSTGGIVNLYRAVQLAQQATPVK
ncbi:S8 family serine peptidase [Hymenobacter psychrophilus]|uniref:Subtilase family protein n=1 Tax=Hymenobacter psychrophilus TaxID=651662 RepID=A0A1H3GWH6_9BACT|nr:S8 family serine peptidase [Hymenobacter psychrophilus]SDY06998.1 Subtilase family protein [Hymenobacter psychrophilus]